MKVSNYLKDKMYIFIIYGFSYLVIMLMLMAFKADSYLIIGITTILFLSLLTILLIDYFRKVNFYNNLFLNIERLDKAYLVLETLNEPHFYEGNLLYRAMYDVNKSMSENINNIQEHLNDFKDYIEMWIHEVKIPLSSLMLSLNNNKKLIKQLKRIDDCVLQVLYYARSENAYKDYLIKEVDIQKVIKNVSLKYMDDLLSQKIDFSVSNNAGKVLTDSKWLEFILGQIISNSIQYKRDTDSLVKISTSEDDEKTVLTVWDNGIGISKSDIKYVFDKSFTGENGRIKNKSTGMGLNICKNMCEKLGHEISIESEKGKYTKVKITFAKNKYYDVVK